MIANNTTEKISALFNRKPDKRNRRVFPSLSGIRIAVYF